MVSVYPRSVQYPNRLLVMRHEIPMPRCRKGLMSNILDIVSKMSYIHEALTRHRRMGMDSDRAGLTVREAGAWASLVTTVLLYGAFFAATASGAVHGVGQIGLLVVLVAAQVAALIVFHIVLAIRHGDERGDERDTLIQLHAFRHAYVVLSGSVATVAIGYVVWGGIATAAEAASAGQAAAAGLREPSVTLVGNALLLCFVAAEVAYLGTQVVLYRRGV